jgi:hypothetical protein
MTEAEAEAAFEAMMRETSEMACQNGNELSYPRHRQGQVCVDVYGRCCGSTGANKLAVFFRA